MTNTSPAAHSGADLARQALAAYKTGRRPGTGPTTPARRPQRRRSDGRDGRDPQTFAAVLERLGTEQGWTAGVRGGDILTRFSELCPQFDGRVIAVAWHADAGRLDLLPGSHAYATNLRLLGRQLRQQINAKLGHETVRELGILPVASLGTAPSTTEPVLAEPAPAAVRPPAPPSAGYLRALAAHHEHRGEPADLTEFAERVAAARARQNAALIARRLPPEEHAEYLAQLEIQESKQPATGIEASIRAARQYARAGRAAGGREPQQVLGAA